MLMTTSLEISSKQYPFWNPEDMTQAFEATRWLPSSAWLSWLETAITLVERQETKQLPLTLEISTLIRRLQEIGIYCNKPHEIREYLLEFPDLMDVIPIAIRAAQEVFPEAQLVLKLYRDPEINDRYLALYVRLKNYDESVIHRIEEAEDRFIDLLVGKAGWLQLTTDFREPGG